MLHRSLIYTLFPYTTLFRSSVLMLLACGIGLQFGAEYFGFSFVLPRVVLEVFGIIGLILIVLEGALDLKLSRGKIPTIRRSEEHTSELQSQSNLVCRLLLEK